MQIHRHTKKLRSMAGYLLIFMIMLAVSIAVFSVKDRIDTARLEKISGNTTEVDKDITTVVSINMHAETIDISDIDIPKVDDIAPPRTTHVFRKNRAFIVGCIGYYCGYCKKRGRKRNLSKRLIMYNKTDFFHHPQCQSPQSSLWSSLPYQHCKGHSGIRRGGMTWRG